MYKPLRRLAIVSVALASLLIGTASPAFAQSVPQVHSQSPSLISGSPSHATQVPCCGGGGWPYSDTANGDCGEATINGNPTSNGYVEMQAQLVSYDGPITGGEAKITWGGPGGSGTILFYPVAASGNWISSVETRHVNPGATMGITLSGYVYTPAGECLIENPAISVPTS